MTNPVPQPILDWLNANAPTNDFAGSLLEQWKRKGSLSPKQIEAVAKILVRTDTPRAQYTIDDINLYGILTKAKENGVHKPAIRLGSYKFKMASEEGRAKGSIWVTSQRREENGEALFFGKIRDGIFYPSNKCLKEDYEDIRDVVANPFGEATAFGQRTGRCCVCGRVLTKGESIDKMIGPICAERFGL
jgi:hypothetical protein